jgi:hypothetical protein
MQISVVNASPTCTIKDYAYNSIPNQPILAGDTGTGITGITESSFASSIRLFPNPASGHLTIALGDSNKKVEVTISDITGKLIYSAVEREAQIIEISTNDFESGIYIVQIKAGDFVSTKRLIVGK